MGLPLNEYIAQQMCDPEFVRAYKDLQPERQVARQMVSLRAKRNMSQAALAESIDTKQSSISRLESMASSPSLSFLKRIADALDADLKIEFVPRES
jgi:ribosome-binding protein aMBF1 (putative translation factor)